MLERIFLLFLLLQIVPCYGNYLKNNNETINDNAVRIFVQTLQQNRKLALPIGVKIWFNESNGKEEGLTCWNKGENFASLGIGHFLWYPNGKSDASFPKLLKYLHQKGIEIPKWLADNYYICPWKDRYIFYREFNSHKMVELRLFLRKTVSLQADFLIDQFIEAVPMILKLTPVADRPFIFLTLKNLTKTPQGFYALIDFMNFKGAGLADYYNGTGLLQVLRFMSQAPVQEPLAAFVWAAKRALVLRTLQQSNLEYENWLKGWLQRVDSYSSDKILK